MPLLAADCTFCPTPTSHGSRTSRGASVALGKGSFQKNVWQSHIHPTGWNFHQPGGGNKPSEGDLKTCGQPWIWGSVAMEGPSMPPRAEVLTVSATEGSAGALLYEALH